MHGIAVRFSESIKSQSSYVRGKWLYYGIFQGSLARGCALENVTTRNSRRDNDTTESSYKRGVRARGSRLPGKEEREREASRVREIVYFFLSTRRKALAPAVCYAQCVASTRRSKFYVCRGVRFGRLPQAASSSGLPESRARAISREREFSLWRRVVVRRSSFTRRHRSASSRSPSASFGTSKRHAAIRCRSRCPAIARD